MATIKAFRNPSKIQYIETAWRLVGHTWRAMRKFPKSTLSIQNEIRQLIDDTEKCIIIANSIRPDTQVALDKKRLLFEQSLGYLDAFDCMMGRFIDHYGHGKIFVYEKDKEGHKVQKEKEIITEDSIRLLAELVDEEMKLLKGVLSKLNETKID